MNHIPETRIDKNAIKAWRILGLLFGLLWFLIPAGCIYLYMENMLNGVYTVVSMVIALVLYLFTGWSIPLIRWKHWRYDVSEKEIDMLSGIIIQKRTLVPINRIQHVDTKQGPVYRRFGLSSVAVSTAATTHEIPALDDETAVRLRNTISELVRQVREDV